MFTQKKKTIDHEKNIKKLRAVKQKYDVTRQKNGEELSSAIQKNKDSSKTGRKTSVTRIYSRTKKKEYEKLAREAKRKLDRIISQSESRGQIFLDNSHIMSLPMEEANRITMNKTTRNAINASMQAASLSISGGTNPYMFGMM